jgi:hypothetical protein
MAWCHEGLWIDLMIGHGTKPAPNADAVGGWGTLESADLEAQYRQQQAPYDTIQSNVVLTIIMLSSMALTLSDYRLFGLSPLFWKVVAIRFCFSLASLYTIVVLQRGLTPHRLRNTVFAWSLLLGAVNIYVASTRPPSYIVQGILNVSVVLMCYLVLPLPLMLQIVPSILMSIGNIALVAWVNPPADRITGAALVVAFVVANILGGIAAKQVHYWKRQQFVAMLRETELRVRLEQALAEIKTLRGILPICSHCKRVRDDTGYWQQVEVYVRDRSYAEFSHAICPTCLEVHYAELLES